MMRTQQMISVGIPRLFTVAGLFGLLALACAAGWSQEPKEEAPAVAADLTQMSLEDLMSVKITLSRKDELASKTASAVYVVTQEDIRRSGATSIPEILRQVPGIQVARSNANGWAISARGFNGMWSNKLLVLMDGRSVYSPLYSGVEWGLQDTMVQDIDHIEIIRGPGAALWGANAVNGIINIVTKQADDTGGRLITQFTGEEQKSISALRLGGEVGQNGSYRFYAKTTSHDRLVSDFGDISNDAWNQSRAGFRMDMENSERSSLVVQGDTYNGYSYAGGYTPTYSAPYTQLVNVKTNTSGKNLLARWKRDYANQASSSLQAYYDHSETSYPGGKETYDTVDVEFQHRLPTMDRHDIIWGLGYRRIADNLNNYDITDVDTLGIPVPPKDSYSTRSIFVQDDITLAKDRWRLTLGSKVEHNDFTGYEVQPNVKVLWTPKDKHTGWLSVARAARTPNRGNYDMSFLTIILPPSHVEPFGDLPTAVMYYPNANFRSEYVTAYELGYRVQPTEKTSIDIATFYNDYKDLASQSIGAPTLDMNPVLHILVPCTVANEAYGHTYGGEISTNWQVSNNWRLAGNFSWINLSITNDTITGASTPRTQFHLRSFLNLPKHLELDSLLWHVSDVPAYAAPSYWKLDVRLGWNMSEDRSFSIGANNLFNSRHKEFGSEYAGYGTVATESTQNFYLNATQKF